MKHYISIILFLISHFCSYAYKIGDVLITKEGDMGVVFFVDQEKVLLVAVKDTLVKTQFCTEDKLESEALTYNDEYELIFNGREQTQELLNLSSKYTFPILEYIPTDRGWYLPSMGEMRALVYSDRRFATVSKSLESIQGSKVYPPGYVTSTLYRDDPNGTAYYTYSIANVIFYSHNAINGEYKMRIRPIYRMDLTEKGQDSQYSYLWNTGSSLPSIEEHPLKATTYSIVAANKENQCQSTDKKTVIVVGAENQEVSDTICEGETYEKYGFKENASGDYTHTIEHGDCTSEVTLHLAVAPKYKQEYTDKACLGKTYKKHGFSVTPFAEGEFHDTLTFISQMGCDSSIILNLEVLPITYDTIQKRICQSEGYKDADFNLSPYQKTGLNYYTVEKTADGCKAYHTLALQVDPTYQVSMVEEVIMGDDYKKNGLDIKNVMNDALYTLNLKSANGCDSIVNLSLVAKDTFTRDNKKVIITSLTDAICEGETYAFKNQILTQSGVYRDTVENFSTLDVTELTLVVHTPVYSSIKDTAMVGIHYNRNGLDIDSFEEVGEFQYNVKLQSEHGCDSIVTLTIQVVPFADNHVIPTVFSPHNQDNSNDFFMAGYEVYIYDRYGNFVSYSKDGWDGKRRGEFADPGVYIYVVKMHDGEEKRGTIEVLK